METILLKHYSVGLFFQCIMGVIVVVAIIACLNWLLQEFFLTWREKKAKQKGECQQYEKPIWLPTPPVPSPCKSVANTYSTISRTDVFMKSLRPATLKLAFYAPSDTMPKRKYYIAMPTFG